MIPLSEKRDYYGTGGTRLPVTDDWRSTASTALDGYTGGMSALAFAIGAKLSTVSMVLSGQMKTSSLVDPISRELGISRPMGADVSPRTMALMGGIDLPEEDDYEVVRAMIERLVLKRDLDS